MTDMACTAPLAQSLFTWVSATKRRRLPPDSATSCLDNMRLEDLVLGLLDLEIHEAARMNSLADADLEFERCPERFHETLQRAIRQCRLSRLFARTHDGDHHRSVCPAAYNERTGEHYPEEMARWRADFRTMSPERQMVAATLVWLYRVGPDSIWLRRVPCTWKAPEALHYLHDAGCLALWLQLMASYPGW